MNQMLETPPTAVDPTVRSRVFKLLSILFKYPGTEVFESYQNGDFVTELWKNLSEIPHTRGIPETEKELPALIKKELEGMSLLDLEVKFNQTFEVGAPDPPCPPNEGLHRKGVERTGVMIEVAEFYKQFGLKMSTEEGKRELPDHLRPELEFLHFLTFKEAQAREEKTPDLLRGYIHAQKDFLERHIMTWLPEFSSKLETSASLQLFAGAGRILRQFIAAEYDYVRTLFEELSVGQKDAPSDVVGTPGQSSV
jgi:DMSO reductase family type II enzyme chaperone